MKGSGLAIALIVAPVAAIFVLLMFLAVSPGADAAGPCGVGAGSLRVVEGSLPDSVAGYSGEQLKNAAAIINEGDRLKINARGQAIAVMTAMGESSLKIIDYGDDAINPDGKKNTSIGLFQQQNPWGSRAIRLTADGSARLFYEALVKVGGWESMPPTLAAHRTQINQDPFHYAKFWDQAVQVVQALVGVRVEGIAGGTGEQACTAESPADVVTGGWTRPATGPLTSPFSTARVHPVLGVTRAHKGDDIGAACNAPIRAVHAGTVVTAEAQSGYGHLMAVDHGGGIVSRYGHMYADGMLAHVGEKVRAGTQIARVGSDGTSTACHLHFEIQKAGAFIDPAPFMAARGVPLN